ncbi:hypothetical protein D1007_55328 [Hordeum vulgare]|nr:hypothetical protein D1007_55328 [Hordeum vulgare]
MVLRSLCRDGFDEPLATPEDGFAALANGLIVALEGAVVHVDKILDNDCHDLFFAVATCVFSHLHHRQPGFDLGSMILPVPTEARDHAVEAVKGPVEALVRRKLEEIETNVKGFMSSQFDQNSYFSRE